MAIAAGNVLILSGPPGSGKTTAAETLACESGGCPKVHLHADDCWRAIRAGAIAPWKPEAHGQNAMVIDVIAGAAARYAAGGCFVIVDGIIGPWFLAPFRELPVPVHYVVLRPSLDEAVRRCALRGGDTLADPEPVAALHGQFADLGALEPHALDVAGQSAEAVRDMIRSAAGTARFRLR